jgi:flavin-dependent dehydrogenase
MAEVGSSYDLAIIGGGPGGCAAAITAARAGASVLLLERGRFPRHKVCGEFVSPEAVGLLASLLANSLETRSLLRHSRRINGARLFVDGHMVETPIDPPAASVARYDLDAALWQAAQASGAEAQSLVKVGKIEGDGPFVLVTPLGQIVAHSVIDASGRWSNLRPSTLKKGIDDVKWIGLKAHFTEDESSDATDLYFFDGGYCGVQRVQLEAERESEERPRINVCAMARADRYISLTDVLEASPELCQRSERWKPVSEVVSTSPLIFRTPVPVGHRHIFRVGDAAGFVDPFVGDGISLALRSGVLAGETASHFLQSKISLSAAAQAYEKAYSEKFLSVFQSSSKIRTLLRLPELMRAPLLHLLEKMPKLTEYLVRQTR